jgi:hypothetical protein
MVCRHRTLSAPLKYRTARTPRRAFVCLGLHTGRHGRGRRTRATLAPLCETWHVPELSERARRCRCRFDGQGLVHPERTRTSGVMGTDTLTIGRLNNGGAPHRPKPGCKPRCGRCLAIVGGARGVYPNSANRSPPASAKPRSESKSGRTRAVGSQALLQLSSQSHEVQVRHPQRQRDFVD